MSSDPAEVVFTICPGSERDDGASEFFSYVNGQAKVPGAWKKGRPKGSKNKVKSLSHVKKQERKIRPEFVNLSVQYREIDRDSRAIIRRNAKLGQGLQQRNSRTALHPHKRGQQVATVSKKVSGESTIANLHQISGVDPFATSQIVLEPYMHDLLFYFRTKYSKNIYYLEGLVGINPIADYWLPIAFNDPALLHSFIGCADVYASGYSTIRDASRGLKHLQTAISIVNRRITREDSVISLGTLAVVAGIALLEKGAGNFDHWRIHMQGLRHLVELRGGLEALSSEPLLLNKIYSADLYGSFNAGETPQFRKTTPIHFKTSSGAAFLSDGFNLVQKKFGLDHKLIDCVHHLEDIFLVWSEIYDSSKAGVDCTHIQRNAKLHAGEVAQVRHLLVNVQYALATVTHQLGPNCNEGNGIFEFCRITLVLYTWTILRDRAPSSSITQQLCSTFQHSFNRLWDWTTGNSDASTPPVWSVPLPLDFCLWAVFLATSLVIPTKSNIKDGLVQTFSTLLSYYAHVQDGCTLRLRLTRYLWIPVIHDPAFNCVWHEVGKWTVSCISPTCEMENLRRAQRY